MQSESVAPADLVEILPLPQSKVEAEADVRPDQHMAGNGTRS